MKNYNVKILINLRKIQLEQIGVIDKVWNKNNTNYSTAFGTVLDVVRYKGFIQWDSEIERKKQFCKALFLRKIMFLRRGTKADIPYKEIKNKYVKLVCWCIYYPLVLFHVKRSYILKICSGAVARYNHTDMERLTSFEDVGFENIMANIMRYYEKYLMRIYGDYVKLLLMEDIKKYYPYILEFGA